MHFTDILLIVGICLAAVALVTLVTAYISFRMTFYVSKKMRDEYKNTEFPIPKGEIYEVHSDKMIMWMKKLVTLPHKDVEIKSFDGLTLRGKFYEYAPGAPMELLFHGYKGSAKRDLNGAVGRCFALGRSALIVDHRGSGESEGNVITFGINESRDALTWIDYIIENIDKDARIFISGVSMGAATVMITAGKELPENVVGAVADCGYTSAKAIIKKVIKDMKLPPSIMYPFVKLGAKIFGGFDLEETSPVEAVKNAKIPIIFFHGDADDFVPWDMSRENFEACTSEKRFVTIPGAGHGLCYLHDKDAYLQALREFYHYVH